VSFIPSAVAGTLTNSSMDPNPDGVEFSGIALLVDDRGSPVVSLRETNILYRREIVTGREEENMEGKSLLMIGRNAGRELQIIARDTSMLCVVRVIYL
jgi:hypothetical protein